ncbi:MAG: asparagine synthase (glutamine-hydrolyzing) [Gallionella sp.]|nr:asparagine synthase (glutamine-hydrolyzing) [Gallionella sp.]MDD4947122.1 asparagine synthase (glutamine-hydrolyzing) [Gallionella sp.]MDD5611464.1 asparagine synthase (glutamine-hydrolyzing) [Gallionella sp.]
MCGIFGVVGHVSVELAGSCLATLQHRGPDGEGVWHTPYVTLGHRRLSILDLSEHAKQPMSYAAGRYHITFNGEIYNFLELREELEQAGHCFTSESDTEVLLAAYAEWGSDCQYRFNGMWAFAIWDDQERQLFLSRDRLGKKPLFYIALPNGAFAFASEMKALFPLMGNVEANTSLVMAARDRMFSYEATDECVIKGIKRFPAGHAGVLKNGKLEIKRWWHTLDHLQCLPVRYEEQVEMFRELFLDACRLRMRSDVPLGTALSGGLDSSATISAMAFLGNGSQAERMGHSWQHAIVAAFPGTPLDETAYAKIVTNHIGIDATIINIDPLQAIDRLDDYFYLFEDLYITSPIPFMLTYEAVKAQGVSVTLDGHGADELFGGYSFDYLVGLRDAGWNLKQAYEIVGTYYGGWPAGSSQFAKLPSKTRYIAEYHARRLARKTLRRIPEYQCKDASHPAWKGLGHLNQQLYVSTHETVLPTLLRNYDRYSMASSVEIRMPFLDHRILSFAFSLPWTSKIRGGYSKAVIRDAAAPFMPDAVTYRKSKLGFNSPVVDWMKGPLKEFMLDLVQSRSFQECGLIDSERVASVVRNVIDNPNARFSDGELAWTLLTPYLWERSVIKRAKRSA